MAGRQRALTVSAALLSVLLAPVGPGSATAVALGSTQVADPAPPLITVTLSEGAMKVTGALKHPAGPVRFRALALGPGHAMSVFRLKPGHTLAEVVADSDAAAKSPRAAAAGNLRRLGEKVDFRGGIGLERGRSATMTLVLEPGTYYISDQTDEGNRFEKVTVTTRKSKAVAVRPSATVTMNEHYKMTGDTILPKKGSIRIRNTATTDSRLYLATFQRVRPGTTVEDMQRLRGPDRDRSILLPDAFGAELLSPGRSETLTYSMPAGTYALQCMIPGHDGVPHAFNGMMRIVTLR